MRVAVYYVIIIYHNIVGRDSMCDIVDGPFFKKQDAIESCKEWKTLEGKISVQTHDIDLQPLPFFERL